MIPKEKLRYLYKNRKKSQQEIAKIFGCSFSKVRYWVDKYRIQTRSISEAIYTKHNPRGDPFKVKKPKNMKEAVLFGLGLGLYWGEGTKANLDSVRLGNTDPKLIKKFIEFLTRLFGVKRSDFRFGLQVFTDVSVKSAIDFWVKELRIKKQQLYKPTITISGSIGTYRKKSKYGVLTVHYHNKKLRNLLVDMLPV